MDEACGNWGGSEDVAGGCGDSWMVCDECGRLTRRCVSLSAYRCPGMHCVCVFVCACVLDSEAGIETPLSLFSSTFDSVLVCVYWVLVP